MFLEVIYVNPQFKKGILELVVLCSLMDGDKYGFELVSYVSQGVNMSEGTVYPLLKRLRDDGLVTTYLVESSGGPARKYYHLTDQGLTKTRQLRSDWFDFQKGIERIVGKEEQQHDQG